MAAGAWAQAGTLKISHQFPGGTINEGDFRDRLCRRELMERVLEPVQARWRMHWLEGAGHSFRDIPEAEICAWISSLRC
jgi:hypothetical protein